MHSKASTVAQYLAAVAPERREALATIRRTILEHLPAGYAEGMQYGMIGYFVPHSVYPAGYHCDPTQPLPFASIAAQKNHLGLYLMCLYNDAAHAAWFRQAWKAAGKKLDMGKACVRVKTLDDVPLAVLGEAIARVPVQTYLRNYEAVIGPRRVRSAAPAPAAASSGTSTAQTSTAQTSRAKTSKAQASTAQTSRAKTSTAQTSTAKTSKAQTSRAKTSKAKTSRAKVSKAQASTRSKPGR